MSAVEPWIIDTRLWRVRTRSMFRLDADPIVNGVGNPLLAAKISLGRLNRHVSKEKLNLVEFTAGLMAEQRASPPEIVRRKFINAGSSRILSNDMPNDFFA